MKKTLLVLMALVLVVSAVGCGGTPSTDDKETPVTDNNGENEEINVGVAFYPMKDILLLIEDDLKEDGYDLKIHEFTDYQVPNELLVNEELDGNMIQHDYFLQSFNEANDADLETVLPIYHATFALYSQDYTDIDDIPEGTSITLPDDATNLSRAIYLLNQAGLITLKDDKTVDLTIDDIDSNPKDLKFDDQVPLTNLAQRYTETGFAIMYPTYAKNLELTGDEERLYVEKQDDVTEGYAISLVSRNDNKDDEKIKALIEHITTDKVKQFLIDEYDWASSPAF